jgi:hypothetical protein
MEIRKDYIEDNSQHKKKSNFFMGNICYNAHNYSNRFLPKLISNRTLCLPYNLNHRDIWVPICSCSPGQISCLFYLIFF